jgi:exodeoxyribonuclease VIII
MTDYHSRPELSSSQLDYHSDFDRISKSMLSDFISDRELFRLRYIDRKLPGKESSPAMDAGTAVHAVLLEGGELEDHVRLVPDDCLQSNGAINGKRLAELKSQTPGIVYVKAAEFGRISAIIESVRKVVPEMGIASAAAKEQAVYWNDTASGLDCRCKPDWYCEQSGDQIICHDLKVTATVNPWDWGRVADRFRYWLQDAHYSAGLEKATGQRVTQFVFWVVEDQYPYRVLRRAYSDSDRKAARQWHANRLCELAACYQTGDWSNQWPEEIPTRSLREAEDLELVEMEETDVPSELAF